MSSGSFDNLFLFVWFCAELLMVCIGSMYLIANNAHPNDTSFAKMWVVRILTWLGFTMVCLPLLLVHLDVTYNKGLEFVDDSDNKYRNVWLLEILMQAAFVWVICPLVIVYYESNERHTMTRRIIKALKAQMPVFLFMIFFTTITALLMRDIYIPVSIAQQVFGKEPNYTDHENFDDRG